LDKLAGTGVRFTRGYTPSPICIPARACLATGTQVHENRCWSSAQAYHGQVESWMHRLRDRDHAVVSIGKLHFRCAEDDNGFSEELLPMHLANGGKGWPQGLIRNPLPGFAEAAEMARDVGPGESTYTEYDRALTDEACRWLRRYPRKIRNKPWVAFVSFVSPHYPLTAPPAFYDLYAGRAMPAFIGRERSDEAEEHPVLAEMRRFWAYDDHFDEETRVIAQRSYYGLCSFLDDNIRRVLEALEDSGAARDTAVIYISDHGEMLGNHGLWAKSVMYEDSVGVPVILGGAGIDPGVNDTPVSLTDIAATVEEITGFGARRAEEPWQSRSLCGFADAPEEGRIVLSQYHDGGSPTGFYMIRQDDWKYVHYANGAPAQLFNLADDGNELRDLGGEARLEKKLDEMRRKLTGMLDPDAVNAEAFAEQAALIEAFGGADEVLAMPSFNHTPVGS
jgi:choline-sulfatase